MSVRSQVPVKSSDKSQVVRLLSNRISGGELNLPLLPVAATRALSLARNADADAAQLARLIQQDQSLAGHVIRVANSSAFSPRFPIVSLQQAIARLGMKTIAEIAVTIVVKEKIFQHDEWKDDVQFMWRHSMASATWAKEIARTRKLNVDNSFLCGLLHQIGRPVVLSAAADIAKEVDEEISHEEMSRLTDGWYLEVGGMLATEWQLPEPITESIIFFNYYEDAPNYPSEARITNAANLFATHMLERERLPEESLRAARVIQDLNLYPDDVQSLLDRLKSVEEIVTEMSL